MTTPRASRRQEWNARIVAIIDGIDSLRSALVGGRDPQAALSTLWPQLMGLPDLAALEPTIFETPDAARHFQRNAGALLELVVKQMNSQGGDRLPPPQEWSPDRWTLFVATLTSLADDLRPLVRYLQGPPGPGFPTGR
jgi:hypothetical protein